MMTFAIADIETYFEQFVGDIRLFNVHSDSRIEAMLREAGIKPDYSLSGNWKLHIASREFRPEILKQMLSKLPLKYGIGGFADEHTNGDVHFISCYQSIAEYARGEYADY